ncbi:formate--tetrahydrofolate ligase [Anthocerotibacter panamensis]|uniref:formate--tetrahydrofolate ligase n=1 Tax=Anthocerotibacter panamensis TaxID=2857077 RepID=UPI001C404933|nr:formate--tetrahydrofolate ligase [Anthocerotibacter panamensis]
MNRPLLPIQSIAHRLGLADRYLEPIGTYGAKLKLELLTDPDYPQRGKLVLVTATTPTKTGEGKTVVAIGLAQGLDRLGKRALVTSREPSLGPVFGVKGGGVGGGCAQVEPSQKINLHFHGDFHAITCAHNLLAAMLDAQVFHGNDLGLDCAQITWPRTLDMNDRPLRQVTIGLGGKRNGPLRETNFVITAASEIMALVGLADSREDLRHRLAALVVGYTQSGQPVRAADLGATGAMMVLLYEAILPNLVQTTEGTPALIHTGPFANLAHGTSSVLAQAMGLRLADYVINETGFGADLGAEKYVNLVMRSSGLKPAAAVLVTTVQGLQNQGQGVLEQGFSNLAQHIQILRRLGVPLVVAINRFQEDSEPDLARVASYCTAVGLPVSIVEAFAKGGAGAVDLAQKVVAVLEKEDGSVQPLYALEDSLEQKIQTVAQEVYGAAGIMVSERAQMKLQQFTELGFANLPICMAKTPYSISDDPKRLGAPSGWMLRVTDAVLAAGAGFIVVLAGDVLLMPGLPKVSRALSLDVDSMGQITGF